MAITPHVLMPSWLNAVLHNSAPLSFGQFTKSMIIEHYFLQVLIKSNLHNKDLYNIYDIFNFQFC